VLGTRHHSSLVTELVSSATRRRRSVLIDAARQLDASYVLPWQFSVTSPKWGSYTPRVGGAGVRGRVPCPAGVSNWAAAHEFYCFSFFPFYLNLNKNRNMNNF
jgi:hypothetical protein